MTNLTPQDINVILTFLNRVDIKGSEAIALVRIAQKLEKIAQENQEVIKTAENVVNKKDKKE